MPTANPAIREDIYRRAGYAVSPSQAMTLQGTVVKTGILLTILLLTGGYTWAEFYRQVGEGARAVPANVLGLLTIGVIGGLITALITVFAPRAATVTAPIYAGCEGFVLGGLSAYVDSIYPGIGFQAVMLTLGTLLLLLFLYSSRIIRATENLKIGIMAATGAICLVYLVDLVMRFFGAAVPFIHETGLIGIGFSVVVVVIASLNLILDFDFIETGAAQGAPKFMEWYGAFSLLVTVVWMYLEILRLLMKLRQRD